MSNLTATHANYINSVLKTDALGGTPKINQRVTQSWIRCTREYALDPADEPTVILIDRAELLERQERMPGLLSIAKLEMANLHQQLAGSGFAVLLTDSIGVVVEYVGDPAFSKAAAHAGMCAGAVWSEENQGTNGMGTCLIEKNPLVIHHNEHFLARNTVLTCSAAPIFDHQGTLLAVLDASSHSRQAQQHTLVLVNMSAQTIENRFFLCQFKNEFVLRFHSRPEFVGTLGEGEIAFSGDGKVLAANRSALFQLGYRDAREIVGKEMGEVFNITLDCLCERSARNWVTPLPIYEAKHGNRFFAITQPPETFVMPGTGDKSISFGAAVPTFRGKGKIAPSSKDPDWAPKLDELEFGDPKMAFNVHCVKRVVNRDIPILICGETGTGKELFAKAIHYAAGRPGRPFVAVNCAAIPESLIESELFGYRAGAFTGASRDGRRGKVLQANGGTLFLDEIGDMPLPVQARLLRVLEEREVLPLGSETPVRVEIKVISATHRNLLDAVGRGEFREDLYYRLQGLTLVLPPLRERLDQRSLIRHILETENEGQDPVEIEDDAMKALEQYLWPGNIRQLRNVLRTILALREGSSITRKDLPVEIVGKEVLRDEPIREETAPTAQDASNPLEAAERNALIQALEQHRWNVTNLAKQLNVSRNTLYRKMKRHGIRDTGR